MNQINEEINEHANSFRNICETEEETKASIKISDRNCLLERDREEQMLKFSKQIDQEDQNRRIDSGEENELSGDEDMDPFEKLEKIHDSKMRNERYQNKEGWIENYISEKGEEFGAKITGSRLIESEIGKTIRREGGSEPINKGRIAREFEDNAGRRPIELDGK
jgi:hypothetical protein